MLREAVILGSLVALAACGAGPAGVPVASAARALPAAAAQSLPRNVLYVSDYENQYVLAFSADTRARNSEPLATIAVGAHPYGLWVDRKGVLYVAAGSSVLEFKPGATTPFRTITQGVTDAEAVTVDARENLYAINNAGEAVTCVEYPAGSVQPSRTLTMTVYGSLFGFPGGATFDAKGNLYVAALFYPQTNGHVFRFAHDRKTGKDLGLAAVGSQDGLAFDAKGNLYVGDFGPIAVYRPGATQPFATLGVESDNPSFFAVSPGGVVYEPVTGGDPSRSSLNEYRLNRRQPIDAITGSFFAQPTGAALRTAAF